MRSAIDLAAERMVQGHPVARAVRLIWQDPVSRSFIQVGMLWELAANAFAFEYADGAQHERFRPLAEFPDKKKVYVTPHLPAFFANRVMSTHRRSYPEYVNWLGLAGLPTPMEVLARSGGVRSTDTFHVVEGFLPVNGQISGSFFASGVRHIPHAVDRLGDVRPGDRLELRRDEDNPVNEGALLLDILEGAPVGYVPDWLLSDLEGQEPDQFEVRVERLNLGAPSHFMLLCQLSGEVS